MSAEQESAEFAAKRWREHGKADLDPEGGFEEVHGRYPDVTKLQAAYKSEGAPYRDYSRDGMAWLREVEATAKSAPAYVPDRSACVVYRRHMDVTCSMGTRGCCGYHGR